MVYFILSLRSFHIQNISNDINYQRAIVFDKDVYQNIQKTLFYLYYEIIYKPAQIEIEKGFEKLQLKPSRSKKITEKYIMHHFIQLLELIRLNSSSYELFKDFNKIIANILKKQRLEAKKEDLSTENGFKIFCDRIIQRISQAEIILKNITCITTFFHFIKDKKPNYKRKIFELISPIKESEVELKRRILYSSLDCDTRICSVGYLKSEDTSIKQIIIDYFIKNTPYTNSNVIYICLDYNLYFLNLLSIIVFDSAIDHFDTHIKKIFEEFDTASNELEKFNINDLDEKTISRIRIKSNNLKFEILNFNLSISDLTTTVPLLLNNAMQIKEFNLYEFIVKSKYHINRFRKAVLLFLTKIVEI